jgi:hypothetical protein
MINHLLLAITAVFLVALTWPFWRNVIDQMLILAIVVLLMLLGVALTVLVVWLLALVVNQLQQLPQVWTTAVTASVLVTGSIFLVWFGKRG